MADRAQSLSFDRIADRYDATRGGEERGAVVAAALRPFLTPGRLLEVGVGTGLVASALRGRGVDVVGVDLSRPMLTRAVRRIGPRVAIGDALRLPVRDASVGGVLAVWLLHLVADVGRTLVEFARVLEPGGRCLVVPGGGLSNAGTDVEQLLQRMWRELQPTGSADDRERVLRLAARAGLSPVDRVSFPGGSYPLAPEELARRMEERIYSGLWEISERVWQRRIRPLVDEVRALPDRDRARQAGSTYELLVFDRGSTEVDTLDSSSPRRLPMSPSAPIRVVVAKPGLDGHDRGAKIVARALRDAGMEVIYTGLHQSPEQIVAAAIQEDADCIGLSVLSGAHMTLFARVVALLRERHAEDIVVFGGGIIPADDIPELHAMGVTGIFGPGATTGEIVAWVESHVGAATDA